MTVTPVTIRLSMLSAHHQQQLKEVLDSVGVELPTNQKTIAIRLMNDMQARGRSESRGRSGVRTRSTSRGPTSIRNEHLQDVLKQFSSFFSLSGNQFRHLHAWKWKPIPPASLISKVDSVLSYVSEYIRRDDRLSIGGLVCKYFTEKLGLKNLTEFAILDLLCSALAHRRSIMEVDIFVRVMTDFYDPTDVLFHDFVKRSVGSSHQLVSLDQCVDLAEEIFGPKHAAVTDAVAETLSRETADEPNAKIQLSYFIYITVWVFHHQRRDMDLRTSQHGFEESVRASFRGGEKNLIDSYVESIIDLKNQTRVLRESHVELERAVERILADTCAKRGADVSQADKLMQIVMSDDMQGWKSTKGSSEGWQEAVSARDSLLSARESEMEFFLRKFCDAIAKHSEKISHSSYY